MPGILKAAAKRAAPSLFLVAKDRYKAFRFRRAHNGAEYRAKRALVRRYGKRVLSGPFEGMRYGDDVACSAYVAKLVGCYEEELHSVIQEILTKRYARVVDIGCAEGYYAVGMALRLRDCLVHAFDTDLDAQRYCARLAKLNGVSDRIHIEGLCDHAALGRLAGPGTLVICDCEGFEGELIDPRRVPSLAKTDLVIELHEFVVAGVTARILSAFEPTHAVTLVDTRERDPAAYPFLQGLGPQDCYWAVREGRPAKMQWAYLVHRA